MSKPWPTVRLGEMLRHFTEYIEAPEPREYRKLSVKLYGKGVVLDAPADGAGLKMKRHQLAKAGQVILSEIWGKKGAIGFVPPEGDGALCTSHFFLFDIDEDKLDRRWLKAIFDANYLQEQLDAEAKGTTGYAAVRPKILLVCEISLPPLAEQRRVVARIEELAAQIHEAQTLRHQAAEETEALFVSSLGLTYQKCVDQFGNVAIDSFAVIKGGKRLPAGERLSDERTPFPYIRVADMENHSVDLRDLKFVPERLQPGIARYIIRSNDVYVTIAGTIGYPGTVPDELDGANLTENAARLVFPDSTKIEKHFIVNMLRSPQVQEKFQLKQTVAAQPKLALHRIASTGIPLPPLAEQRRIVAELDALQSEVDALSRLQAETAAELAALLPSILDRAFKGEL
jgi:type I restriction enzyme S subunit